MNTSERNPSNPFELDSKKYRAYELFLAGASRADFMKKVVAMGAKQGTAATWFAYFIRRERDAQKSDTPEEEGVAKGGGLQNEPTAQK